MVSIPQSRPAQEIQSPWAQAERFYLGLPGTGHVCRPTCPTVSRAEHKLLQYATLEETRSEGLQPCCRCTPHRVTRQQHALARAKAILDDHSPAPDLVSLAQSVGMDRSHFQRIFQAAFGLSPKQYALEVRASRFKAALLASPSVTQAMYEAGHNTPRTLYDRTTDRLGMTPLVYRSGGAGITVRYTFADLSVGRVLVAATERGVCAVYLSTAGEDEELRLRLRDEFPRAWLVSSASTLSSHVAALRRQAAEMPRPLTRLALGFHERVWAVLGHQAGTAPTYADIAAWLNLPTAEEAVAAACEAPPIMLPWPRLANQGREVGPTTGPIMKLSA